MLYSVAAPEYLQQGWRPIPLPPKEKTPPRKGFTGYNGREPSREEYLQWFEADMKWRGIEGFNLALVLPDDLIALDIDKADGHKVKADGLETITALEKRLGVLPPTVTNGHGSPDNPYRHRLYRVPKGMHFDAAGPGIDTVQHTHRYLCAWPSVHPSGERYEWYGPDGQRLGHVPSREEIAKLPDAWVKKLETKPLPPRETPAGPMPVANCDTSSTCKAVQTVVNNYLSDPTYGKSSRHDGFVKLSCVLAKMEAEGHLGAWNECSRLAESFAHMVAPERKSDSVAQAEADSAMRSAWSKYGGAASGEDPCETFRREHAGRVQRFQAKRQGTF